MDMEFGHIVSHINTVYVLATKPGVLAHAGIHITPSVPNLAMANPNASTHQHLPHPLMPSQSSPNLFNSNSDVGGDVTSSPSHGTADPHFQLKDRDTSVMRLKGRLSC
jgi:hypothetical protein